MVIRCIPNFWLSRAVFKIGNEKYSKLDGDGIKAIFEKLRT